MRRFLSLTWALCGLSVLSAQTPYTLKSCLETGLERNYSIRIARNDERISSSNATRATTRQLIEQIECCPSGALSYRLRCGSSGR